MKRGVLLANLGTPDAPTPAAVRRYLREFLWDPRVIDVWRPLWWLILNGIILNTRPRRSAEAYAKVWTPAGSPLLVLTQELATSLSQRLAERLGEPVPVVVGMRYGHPSIADGMAQLLDTHGVERVAVLPLYPQNSAATVASVYDAVFAALAPRRRFPELRTIVSYAAEPAYIAALAATVREHVAKVGEPDAWLVSFHGLPRRYVRLGDPYEAECQATAAALAAAVNWPAGRWQMSFQSRFGREEWLKPYTVDVLREWPKAGVKRVAVLCPGFAVDCVETLEEISLGANELFIEHGGTEFRYVPCLNARPDHADALAELAVRHLG